MPYNPNIHHRRSIRLKGYDYSQAGLYFISICKHKSECLIGKIAWSENFLPIQNDFQKMIPRSIGSNLKGFKMRVTTWFRNNAVDSLGSENYQPLLYMNNSFICLAITIFIFTISIAGIMLLYKVEFTLLLNFE
jgi:hypothetical protein